MKVAQKSNKRNRTKMSKKMGYIGNVNEVKGMLEKLYNNKNIYKKLKKE